MSKRILSFGLAAGLAIIVSSAFSAPTVAAPASGSRALVEAAGEGVTQVAYRHRRRAYRRAYRRAPVRHYGARAPYSYDNVGSIVYDGGYGYNRITGQRYMSCMFDEGYGRVRPCDAGGGGGGRN